MIKRICFTSEVASTHTQDQPSATAIATSAGEVRKRIAAYDWVEVRAALDRDGFARLPNLLATQDCTDLTHLYPERERFRSFIDMGARQYGEGTYQYFANPLPPLVRSLRLHLYARLAPVANDWSALLSREPDYPARLATFVERCHQAGQLRPTPLLLRYETDGFNCVHQDVYGEIAFPFQVAVLLSRSPKDARTSFTGGEFLVSEQRPRQQTQIEALTLKQGEGLIFANQFRPVEDNKVASRAVVKHGVSRVKSGVRFTLGIIFHDAQ